MFTETSASEFPRTLSGYYWEFITVKIMYQTQPSDFTIFFSEFSLENLAIHMRPSRKDYANEVNTDPGLQNTF